MKKVLVIGGTGIVGQPLIYQLSAEYDVYSIALDRALFSGAVKQQDQMKGLASSKDSRF